VRPGRKALARAVVAEPVLRFTQLTLARWPAVSLLRVPSVTQAQGWSRVSRVVLAACPAVPSWAVAPIIERARKDMRPIVAP
jgi:hypothetical protein